MHILFNSSASFEYVVERFSLISRKLKSSGSRIKVEQYEIGPICVVVLSSPSTIATIIPMSMQVHVAIVFRFNLPSLSLLVS